jgi:hypothetical protein
MLELVHDHMMIEVNNSNRTDTILVVVAILFNITTLCINSSAAAVAGAGGIDQRALLGLDITLAVLVLMVLAINAISLVGLLTGRATRKRLLDGLGTMYEDNQVAKYYDRSLASAYGSRYLIFSGVIIVLGAASILVPVVLRIFL